MKTVLKIITMIVYLFLLNYLPIVFDVPRDKYFIIVVLPLTIGGIFLIDYLFKDKTKTQ